MDSEIIRRERCPKCKGEAFKNNFLLTPGHHARVFVECAACGAFVARYILHAYVDPNFDLTASLNRLRHMTNDESPRAVVDEMAIHQRRAREQFTDMVTRLDKAVPSPEMDRPLIEIIRSVGTLEDE